MTGSFYIKRMGGTLLAFLFVMAAHAQQVQMVNHYFYKPVVYNPAFTGAGEGMNVFFASHNQWSGFKGAPRYNFFSLDKGFNDKKIGLGMNVISDKKGINNKLGGNILFSAGVKINDNARMAFGLSAGATNQSLDFSGAVVENSSDATFFSSTQSKTTFDGSAGLALISKKLEVGLVVLQLIKNKINYADNALNTYYISAQHYLSSIKYRFFLSEEKNVSLAPQILLRMVPNAPLQYDGNLNLEWKDKFWIGATYKSDYAVAANVGFCVHKQFSIGYSYDFMTGEIGKYSGMSHEIMLNLRFGKDKKAGPKPVAPEPEPVAEEPKPEPKPEPVPESKPDSIPVQKEIPKPAPEVVKSAEVYEKQFDNLETKPVQPVIPQPKKEIAPAPVKKEPVVVENTSSSGGVWMSTDKAANFKDNNGRVPATGYYVIVRSFHNRDYTLRAVGQLTPDYKEANWMHFEPTNFDYVFIKKLNSKGDAFKFANDLKSSGINDAWVQQIVE